MLVEAPGFSVLPHLFKSHKEMDEMISKNDWHNEDHGRFERENLAAVDRVHDILVKAVRNGEVPGLEALPVRDMDMAVIDWHIRRV